MQRRVEDGTAHAVFAFLHCGFGQAHQGERRQAIGHVHFDGDGGGFYTDLGAAVDDGEGHARSLNGRAASCGFFKGRRGGMERGGEVLQNVSGRQCKTNVGAGLPAMAVCQQRIIR